MWFIQADMLPKVLIAAVIFAFLVFVLNRAEKTKYIHIFSTVLNIVLLTVFSYRLSAIYIGYVVITYLLLLMMKQVKYARKVLFVMLTVVFLSPFLLWRLTSLPDMFGETLVLVGFSYNMLKAVDALFYIYYTDLKIPFFEYTNFITFFPVFTAGPIMRYRDFTKQFKNPLPPTLSDVSTGVRRFILGMFKKVVLVTVLSVFFDRLSTLETYHWYSSIAILVLAYVILFVDLSGYSDMAVGVGRLMGVTIPENFKQPWTSTSFTQFWRKWHVTLGDWIREHIFVVVQGKQLKKYQSAIIGMCTMVVMSLWHEFSIMTVVGGIYMGMFLVIENLFSLSTFNARKEKKYKFFIRCAFVNFFFAVNALTFSLDLPKILEILKGLVN